ncbi:DUF2125 domain-containing protein [soil metagenome]
MTASPPDSGTVRASRRTRLWLFAPATLLLVMLIASSAGWLWVRGRLVSEMDARADALRGAGWTVAWSDRTLSGFPFRLKIELAGLRVKAPGEHGWGAEAPRLEAQAYVALPTHWVFVAPLGITILRPVGGPLQITGSGLCASTAGMSRSPWRIVVEGEDLVFAIPAGAKPFSFTAMKRFEFALKPADETGGDAAVLLQVEGAKAEPASVVTRLTGDAPVTLAATGRLTHLAQAHGGWSDAVRAWSAAGGALQVERVSGAGGRVKLDAVGGMLGVDAQGRLKGAIPLKLRQSEAPLSPPSPPTTPAAQAAEQAQADALAADVPLVFADGKMRLGPAVVGPAPVVR